MAWAGSGIFTQTFLDILGNTTESDLNTSTWNIALYTNAVVPAFDGASATNAFGTGTWSGTEVSGTNWATGGVALVTPTLTVADPAAGKLSWDADDVSVATTTLAAFEGCLIYDATIATPVNDLGLVAVDFTAPYSTTAGTLTVTWHADGIFNIDLSP